MTYTIWHRGRCLGESPLDFIYREHQTRTGFLHPTPLGEKVLPLAGGTCAAANALHRAARHCRSHEERERLPEYAAFEAACRTSASYRLELRDFDDDSPNEPWRGREEPDGERRMSRFQVMVELIDDASVP